MPPGSDEIRYLPSTSFAMSARSHAWRRGSWAIFATRTWSVDLAPGGAGTLSLRADEDLAPPRMSRRPPTKGKLAGVGSERSNVAIGSTLTTVPSGSAPAGTSTATPPAPSTRPPAAPTTTLPSAFRNAASGTAVLLPSASRIVSSSLSVRDAITWPLKLPSALGVSVVIAPLARFLTTTVPPGTAVPCVPAMVVLPFASGIVAVTAPAGGGGGGVTFTVVNCATKGAPIGRPTRSLTVAATVT